MTKKLLQNRKFLSLLLACFLFVWSGTLEAQTVSGVVRSADDDQPLNGVTVQVKGSTRATTTDPAGNYKLTGVTSGSSLVFSFVGYKSQTVPVSGRNKIDINLQTAASSLDQVVVIGYGSVKKIDLTGSVGYVNVGDIAKAPVSSFAEALAGRVAGVQVNSSDGQPGGGINIMIRGAGSLTQNTSPLYVIDGFPVENLAPATLNPEEIESMSILKDASSTAIYGSRGANGVILIQTKRGKIGRPVVTLTSSLGYQIPPKPIPLMSPYEFVKYQLELNPTTTTTPTYFANGKTLDDYKNVKGINWQDKVIRPGVVQIYNLAVRGGTDQTKYAISGSIFDQKGVIINTGQGRYSGRITLDQTISKKIKTGVTVNYTETKSYGQQIRTVYGNNPTSTALARAWLYRPIAGDTSIDLLTAQDDPQAINNSDFRINPFLDLENQYQHTITDLLEANSYISYDITKYLTFRTTAGIRQTKIRNDAFYNSKTSQGSPLNPNNPNGINGSVLFRNYNSFSNENTLNYKKTFGGGHTFSGLLLFAVNSFKTNEEGYSGRELPNEGLGMDGLDEGITYNPVSLNSINTMASYATRLDYNYKSRYLVTFNFRADGSSKFLDHWGYFPGGAVAWNMDQEDFFRKALPFISNSKLRVSYGVNGNNRVGDFDPYPHLVESVNGYSFNNQTPLDAVYISSVGNSKLKWEKTKTIDMGYEFGILDNKISLELDLYRRITQDLLLDAILPPSTGFGSAEENIGKLKNEGIEITLNTLNVTSGSFSWRSNFNISFNKNEVLELTRGQQQITSNATYVSQFNTPLYIAEIGKPAGMMIGLVWDGNYQYADFDNPSPGVYILKNSVPTNGAVRNTIQPGDIKYKDLNGDGVVNVLDKTIIGRGQPIHTGGFSNNFTYKGFSMNMFFQWSYGNSIYNANRLLLEGNSNGFANINQFASYVNRWSPDNQTNENYRTRGQGPIGMFSSKNVEDGSYLRLKTLSVSYSIPGRLIKKLYLSNLTIDVAAQNLLTWTKYTGMDPEVSVLNNVLQPGYDYSAYPNARTLVFGIKAAF